MDEFHRRLPLDAMRCDASALLGECRMATHLHCGVRLSDEAMSAAADAGKLDRSGKDVKPNRSVAWELGAAVRSPVLGVWSCVLAGPWELGAALVGLVALPIKGLCVRGPYGLLVGLLVSVLLLLLRPLYALVIMADRLGTGCLNGCCGAIPSSGRFRDHVMDPEAALTALARLPLGEPLVLRRKKSDSVEGSSSREALEGAYCRVMAWKRAFEWCAGRATARAGVARPRRPSVSPRTKWDGWGRCRLRWPTRASCRMSGATPSPRSCAAAYALRTACGASPFHSSSCLLTERGQTPAK